MIMRTAGAAGAEALTTDSTDTHRLKGEFTTETQRHRENF